MKRHVAKWKASRREFSLRLSPASLSAGWTHARTQHSFAHRARKPITMWAPYFTVWCGQKWVLWERSHIEGIWENKIQHLEIREREGSVWGSAFLQCRLRLFALQPHRFFLQVLSLRADIELECLKHDQLFWNSPRQLRYWTLYSGWWCDLMVYIVLEPGSIIEPLTNSITWYLKT